MKISVDSSKPIQNYYLLNLHDKRINFAEGVEFDCATGWYNLIVEYSGEHIDITDIKINDESIEHFLHTGFFTEESTGKVFQPANAVWTEGYYSIWLHTEIGYLISTVSGGVRNGDYGKYLFDDYMLTVDKSIDIGKGWPEKMKSYFRHGVGPRWWRKGKKHTPYEPLAPEVLKDVDKVKLLRELEQDCQIEIDYPMLIEKELARSDTMHGRAMKRVSNYPFVELDDLVSETLREVAEKIGFKRLLNVTMQTATPGQAFRPHRDDHYTRDCREHIEGPVVFIWDLAADTRGHLFKLGYAGLVPIDHGAFFNQFYFDHGTINGSETVDRPLLIMHGERDRNIGYL